MIANSELHEPYTDFLLLAAKIHIFMFFSYLPLTTYNFHYKNLWGKY